MSNMVSIDGTNLATLGIFILKGGDFDLLSFPERIKPATNNWFEHDGLEVDLSNPVFKSKSVEIQYYISADNTTTFISRLEAFKSLHFTAGKRTLYVGAFNKSYTLRTVDFPRYEHKGGLAKEGKKSAKISVKYTLDNPTEYFTLTGNTPTLNRANVSHLSINGYDLSKFGMVVQEAYGTILCSSQPKSGIKTKIYGTSGDIVDVDFTPKKESRKIIIESTMITNSYTEFEENYTALFRQLSQPGSVSLGIYGGSVINCYYSKMTNFSKNKPLTKGGNAQFNLELITI